MAEVRNCPYCGEEILAVAKKCKHCGEWLDGREKETKKKSPQQNLTQPVVHVHNTVQQSNTQEQVIFHIPSSDDGWLGIEIVLVSAFGGIYLSSWWVFFGCLMTLGFMLVIPILNTILCIGLAFFMGILGWAIGKQIGGDWAPWVIGIISGIGALIVNLQERKEL